MITITGSDMYDINKQLGRLGPNFDVLIKFRREDYERKHAVGGIITFAHKEVPIECMTDEDLIAALARVLNGRTAWIRRTDGGTNPDSQE